MQIKLLSFSSTDPMQKPQRPLPDRILLKTTEKFPTRVAPSQNNNSNGTIPTWRRPSMETAPATGGAAATSRCTPCKRSQRHGGLSRRPRRPIRRDRQIIFRAENLPTRPANLLTLACRWRRRRPVGHQRRTGSEPFPRGEPSRQPRASSSQAHEAGARGEGGRELGRSAQPI